MYKERYEYIPRTIDNVTFDCELIYDTETNDTYELKECCDLLNKQYRRIKELEEQVKTKETINNLYKSTLDLKDNDFSDLVTANVELKKHQKQLAIEELEKLKDEFDSPFSDDTYSAHKIMDKIDEYIEELKLGVNSCKNS